MAHGDLIEDLLPPQPSRAQVLPGLLLLRKREGPRLHESIDHRGMGVGDPDRVLKAHLRIFIFRRLIGIQRLQPPGDGTL